ncbi:Uma2 family endonuclease [Vulcanococcus limneticus]|uniref:Uma2 family endonuclease n=1 Tax=Vulcanococcus limneticus TaxID=2170428 RepID=UPI00398C16AF
MDALAPLRLPADLWLTPEQFKLVCAENREALLELDADGRLIAMTPTGSEAGYRSGELFFQLKLFAKRVGECKAFDSSTGFHLPDGSVFSPDASLLRLDRWLTLSADQRRGFASLCPVLVAKLASTTGVSPSDEGPTASRPCTTRWPPIRPMTLGLAGC